LLFMFYKLINTIIMKKIYFFLVAMVATSMSFGQVTNGGFETWAGGMVAPWTSESGATITEETTIFTEGSKSTRFDVTTQTQGDTDFRQTVAVVIGKIYDVSVKIYQTDNKARARLYVDGYRGYSDPSTLNSWQTITYEYTATATGNIDVGLRFYDISADWAGGPSIMYADDFQMVEQVAPSIAITSPADSSTGTSTNVTISLSVNNFIVDAVNDGNGGHIHYTVDGNPDVMKFDTNDILLSGLAVGPHTVVARLVDDSHVDIAGPISATVNFTIAAITQVSDIATLRAGILNDYYELTGEALLTFQQSYRNQKFIEDSSAAILIDDNTGTITTSYNVMDGITGIKGQLGTFGGMMQFIPTEDPGAVSSTGNTLTPQALTLATLAATPGDYESELVTVTGVMMSNTVPAATPNFADGIVHEMDQGGNKFNFRSSFFGVDYIGELVPTVATDVTGIVNKRTSAPIGDYLTARNADDISQVTLSIAENKIEGFKIFPNPTNGDFITITTANNRPKNVQVFDMLGKKIIDQEVATKLNIAALQTGIYIVKVTENNLSATKRLIVK